MSGTERSTLQLNMKFDNETPVEWSLQNWALLLTKSLESNQIVRNALEFTLSWSRGSSSMTTLVDKQWLDLPKFYFQLQWLGRGAWNLVRPGIFPISLHSLMSTAVLCASTHANLLAPGPRLASQNPIQAYFKAALSLKNCEVSCCNLS